MIDINAYAGPWPFRPLPAESPAEVAALLQTHGVTRALVSPLEALFFADPGPANERLCARIPDEGILGLCAVVNPALPNWRETLHAARETLGARAVKLHPNYHGCGANSSEGCECLAAAGEIGLPVILQVRMQDTRAQHPLCPVPDASVAEALAAAAESPATRVILGGIRFGELLAHAEAIRSLPCVWADLSQVEHVDEMRRAIAAVGVERLLFGTHAPLFNVRSALLKLEEGLLTAEEREAITEGNARKVLSLWERVPEENGGR